MIKPLTSLRIVFALMVFLSHLQFFPKTDTVFAQVYASVFYEGSLGVGFFFILSGFVLSLSYKQRFFENRITYREYLVARVARIYPLHLLTLLISVPLSFPELKTSVVNFSAKFFADLLLIQSWVPDPAYYFSFNGPAWSISAELFFYLVFPLLILLARPGKMWTAVILLLIPALILITPEMYQHRLFYINPFFRSFDFFLGILLYELYERGIFKPVSRAAGTAQELFAISLFLGFFMLHKYVPQGFRHSCYYWLPMTVVILTFAYARGAISDVLSNKWLVLGGEISFGFYLVHQLVIRYLAYINGRLGILHNYYLLAFIMLVISLVASYFLYKLYEMPMNKFVKEMVGKKKDTAVEKLKSAQAA
ncbi:acyltransferase [Chitinophaga sp. CF418]|uniref:acyltransferase family protein n=1 Tax=Chitinophaga sp. CF418 TaxID=1855287 RepID=UPI0009103A89|nr:acyltransferase [Chitinophaga sp. CF418]SHN31974.1 Peptidoglycan/LPS O-acetylase OafA/YrhL, contains acyltransferase and SGNH-hydrolase domains [Chitinophaga sp. CF418]